MTVASTTSRADYTCNGTTVAFTVPFYFIANGDVEAILAGTDGTVTPLVLTTDYSLSGAGNPSGGALTTTIAQPSGAKLSILRSVAATQNTHYVENDPFPSAAHEQALDKLTMIAQQTDEVVSRALVFPATETTVLPIPSATLRANTVLFFAADGSPSFIDPGLITATADADAAATSADAAAASAASANSLATVAATNASNAASSATAAANASITAAAKASAAAASAASAASAGTTAATTVVGSLATSLANQTDATQGAGKIGITPTAGSTERGITLANFIVGKCTTFKQYGDQDGTDQTANLIKAAASGKYVEFVEGSMLVSSTIYFASSGGGFFGVGNATQFIRNFSGTALPVFWNNYGVTLMGGKFYLGCTDAAYAGLVEGDNGMMMGQPDAPWAGGNGWDDVFIQGQWRGVLAFNGPLAVFNRLRVEYCKSVGVTATDGSFAINEGRIQFNAGDGIYSQATNPSAGNLTLSDTTTYYNGGYGLNAPAVAGTHGANLWAERQCSSFDHLGGINVNYHDNLTLVAPDVEYAGASTTGPTNPFTGLAVNWGTNATAAGILLADGTTDPTISGGRIKDCSGPGITLHATVRPNISGLTLVDNGLAFTTGSAPARAGLNVQNGNTDINITGLTAKGPYQVGGVSAQQYGVCVSTADNTGYIEGLFDTYLEEVPQGNVDLVITGKGPSAGPSIASATSLVLPLYDDFPTITGSTTINSIAAQPRSRKPVTLMFPTSLTVNHNGGNIYLAGGVNFVAPTNSTLTLRPTGIGGGWQEIARSPANG